MRSALRWIPAVAILGFPLAASAQSSSATVSWGLIGGVNFASVSGNDVGDPNNKLGYAIGLTMQKAINDNWSFNGEAHYTTKGTKDKEGPVTTAIRLNYLEVPLLFRGKTSEGAAKWFLEFGGAPALKLMCDVEDETAGGEAERECVEEGDDGIKTFDFGLVGGGGLEWSAMGRPWTLGARYTFGLIEIGGNGSGRNSNVQLLLGMRFR